MPKSTPDKKTSPKKQRAAKAPVREVSITAQERKSLYASARYLPLPVREKLGLRIPLAVYLQDPLLSETDAASAIDPEYFVNWEPNLAHGPTSARFAVVDYNGDNGHLAPPAQWNSERQRFFSGKNVLDASQRDALEFHQVSVWALVQSTLDFYEDGNGLGRRIPWGFEGNRLIIVPHAGYGENAFYDRESKSLQFYYFGTEQDPVYTCLSTDIVCHEFGHAVLDGVRPYFNESIQVQTAAFHEAVGDLTAILMSFRSNTFRHWLVKTTNGRLDQDNPLGSIAEQFGQAVQGKPYLRNALNKQKLSSVAGSTSPHTVSTVLVGAMYEILTELSAFYNENSSRSFMQKFWDLAQRFQRMVIQPLDLLPPVDVTFRDYALAVLRAEQIANPLDPNDYRSMLIKVFRKREIINDADVKALQQPQYLFGRLRPGVHHSIDEISRSRAAAYRFLDDNREELFIPRSCDFVIADLYDARKLTREAARLPRQVILEYLWREDVPLQGPEFGRFDGQSTTMLCGGTLVFDDNGNVLSWARKPGTTGLDQPRGADELAAGQKRRQDFLTGIATQVASGRIGSFSGSEAGLLGTRVPPLIAEGENGTVRFRLAPHLHLSQDHQDDDGIGERKWQISC